VPQTNIRMDVRGIESTISIIDIQGDVSAAAEQVLTDAYAQANMPGVRVIILNFTDLAYMNSSGIGLLVTLLVRVKRQKQHLLAYGLSAHYRRIFDITRLSDAILLYDTEQDVLGAARAL
jgi:anti-sigma B factor antagonist